MPPTGNKLNYMGLEKRYFSRTNKPKQQKNTLKLTIPPLQLPDQRNGREQFLYDAGLARDFLEETGVLKHMPRTLNVNVPSGVNQRIWVAARLKVWLEVELETYSSGLDVPRLLEVRSGMDVLEAYGAILCAYPDALADGELTLHQQSPAVDSETQRIYDELMNDHKSPNKLWWLVVVHVVVVAGYYFWSLHK